MRDIRKSKKQVIWLSTLFLGIFSSVIGSVVYPKEFYAQFIWRYFWGPVVADAYGVQQVERINGMLNLNPTSSTGAVIAEPGYTTISTVTYAAVLVYVIAGLVLFSDKFKIRLEKETFIGLIPFMIVGGLLRVSEDINTIVYGTTESFTIPFPYNTLLISPLIYGTIFAVSLLALYISIEGEKREIVDNYHVALGGIGVLLVMITLCGILVSSVVYPFLSFNYLVLLITIILSTGLSISVYYGLERFSDEINDGTGVLGIVVIWAHSLDGVVNVISLDWAEAVGLGVQYQPKHVVNSLIRQVTSTVQPEAVSNLIGVTWSFIILKVGVAVFLIWAFDEEFENNNRRLFVLLLLAATAVGLGPGSRDLMRIVIGV